jgi:hypothetical protein
MPVETCGLVILTAVRNSIMPMLARLGASSGSHANTLRLVSASRHSTEQTFKA